MVVSSVDFTVVVPTYNGASRVPTVLKALQSQVGTNDCSWEVIVVDNNSSDNLKEVFEQQKAAWQGKGALLYVFEKQQGLAFARQAGVEAAKGSFVGFLDDDTVPNSDWLSVAYQFGAQHPKVGAFGGQIHGAFESPPPDNFKRIQSFLAIKEHGADLRQFNPDVLFLPAGAGLVIRRQAWLESVPRKLARTTRGGNDFEISIHLHKAGWEIWYNPDLHITHSIPSWRLEPSYLLKLSDTVGSCICELRVINSKKSLRLLVFLKVLFGSLKRVVLHWAKYRNKLSTDIVAACEMVFFVSEFLSTFEFLKSSLKAKLLENFYESEQLT
ncbi:MAG: hormogonium polysaccharide biosynthesis glycosyltransferase HpsE [Cyanobacteria bacterium J06623_4]